MVPVVHAVDAMRPTAYEVTRFGVNDVLRDDTPTTWTAGTNSGYPPGDAHQSFRILSNLIDLNNRIYKIAAQENTAHTAATGAINQTQVDR